MKRIALLFMLGVGALFCLTTRDVPEVAAQAGGAKKEIKAQGWGSVKGTVTVKGNVPAGANVLAMMKAHADAPTCCAGKGEELEDPTWIVDPKTKGVKYVAIWLKTQPGEYFEINEKDRQRKNPIVIDQPHCAFEPHVVAVYPEYFDGQKTVKTGEKFIVKNSSTVVHNANVSGDPAKNPGMNNVIPPGTDVNLNLQAQRLPISITCGIHSWMSARVFVFDHPYYAITDDQGNFEIPRVPAGVEVAVMSWHEGVGYVEGGKEGKKITFKAGENKLNLTITPP